ncbi:hypothetical protein [Azonexus hydrophilus]|uniref:hypothetical protein n=1 Tax=Azonexus hydrophilus TaxID=418702 RepID=UPI001965D004|nr:hypothetical protein [Azonexus hydrophilus]
MVDVSCVGSNIPTSSMGWSLPMTEPAMVDSREQMNLNVSAALLFASDGDQEQTPPSLNLH